MRGGWRSRWRSRGSTTHWLAQMQASRGTGDPGAALRWLAAAIAAHSLVSELHESTERMS